MEGDSKEWSIIPYDNHCGPFSLKGDSAAVVVDGRGRIGGIITGGNGKTASSDMTYVTPIWFLQKRIKENGFPDAYFSSS